MSLELKRLQSQHANVRAARIALELKIEELNEAAERIKRDIEVSAAKEAELEAQIKEKQGE